MAEIEDAVFAPDRPRGLDPSQRIFKLKREVLDFYRNTEPLLEPLGRLAAGQLPGAHPELGTYFRDVEDHLKRAVSAISHYRDLLSDALDANLAQVTVRQNDDMRTISAWLAIGGFPTVVGAIYGMNFEHMPELGEPLRLPDRPAPHARLLLLPLPPLQAHRLVVGSSSLACGGLRRACPGRPTADSIAGRRPAKPDRLPGEGARGAFPPRTPLRPPGPAHAGRRSAGGRRGAEAPPAPLAREGPAPPCPEQQAVGRRRAHTTGSPQAAARRLRTRTRPLRGRGG